MNNSKTVVIMLVLVVISIFSSVQYFSIRGELTKAQLALNTQNTDQKVLDFTKLFIEKVLKADNEIDFETRLQLENGVRSLNNEQILAQWQKFTDSKSESGAQAEVKNLLELLVNNISPAK